MKIPIPTDKGKLSPRVLWTFIAGVFVLGWVFWIPSAIMFGSAIDPLHVYATPLFVVLQTIGAASPSIVAYFVIKRFYGKDRVQEIVARYKVWRLPLKWYLAAACLAPALSGLSILVYVLVGGVLEIPPDSPVAEIGIAGFILLLPVMFAGQLISSPLLEELGWRGFLLPYLQERMSAWDSSIALGFIWGVWHLPLTIAYGESILSMLPLIVAHSVLMTWVFNNTGGSMWMMLIMHGSYNVALTILDFGQSEWIEVILAWLVVGVVTAMQGREHLGRIARLSWSDRVV